MTRLKWALPAAAALLVGCGGDTGTTKVDTRPATNPNKTRAPEGGGAPSGKAPTKSADAKTEAANSAPIDVSEPPPPKAVADKEKASKDKKPSDDPKAPPPVNKSTSEKKDG